MPEAVRRKSHTLDSQPATQLFNVPKNIVILHPITVTSWKQIVTNLEPMPSNVNPKDFPHLDREFEVTFPYSLFPAP